MRRINPLLRKYKAALLIINQVRSKVGVMFGDPRTKAGGGKALLYYCGVSIETISGKSDVLYDSNKNPLGISGKVKCVKNKVTVPFQDCEFELLYNKGLTPAYGMTVSAFKSGAVESPSKGWYAVKGQEGKHRAKDLDSLLASQVQDGTLV